MAIVRVQKRNNPFVQIDKTPINDDRLSWKAKGILIYLLSKPHDWKVRIKDLVNHAKDGEKAIYSGLKELEDVGYISRIQSRGKDGSFSEYEYLVYETPIEVDSPHTQKGDTDETLDKSDFSPHRHFGDADKRDAENRQLTNIYITNDDDDINKSPQISFFEGQAKKNKIPKKLIDQTTKKLKTMNTEKVTADHIERVLFRVLEKYKRNEISSFPAYFVETLENEIDRQALVDSEDHQVDFAFYNWLED